MAEIIFPNWLFIPTGQPPNHICTSDIIWTEWVGFIYFKINNIYICIYIYIHIVTYE